MASDRNPPEPNVIQIRPDRFGEHEFVEGETRYIHEFASDMVKVGEVGNQVAVTDIFGNHEAMFEKEDWASRPLWQEGEPRRLPPKAERGPTEREPKAQLPAVALTDQDAKIAAIACGACAKLLEERRVYGAAEMFEEAGKRICTQLEEVEERR